MLKALELFGFKSFADKTRFEFPAGITVVVGPNGSGKSNVVDAIKWVLGEQSAKSLRGKDMADVIFKGGGDGARKVMNAAEATIVFENADRRLPVDAPEVHITRRVFRSGEGEYLINRQPCRLKDIRDLFRGTGVGTDAYSIIEQGKVDQLLQASSRDRRAIFEEAAGISRFKAKKIETQRRLERIDQNLLRLSDIVEEVENRLKSMRAQASKARRYREYQTRLQELRTQVGMTDWRQLTRQLETLERDVAELRENSQSVQIKLEVGEAQALECDVALGVNAESIRASENRLAGCRELIAARELANDHARRRGQELEEELARLRTRLVAMSGRAGGLQSRLQEAQLALQSALAEQASLQADVTVREGRVAELERQVAKVRKLTTEQKHIYEDRQRGVTELQTRLHGFETQLGSLAEAARRSQSRLDEAVRSLQAAGPELIAAQREERHLEELMCEHEQLQRVAAMQLASTRTDLSQALEQSAALQERVNRLSERAAVLQELEDRSEGLSTGVRDFLKLWKDDPLRRFREVRGLVAELLTAPVEWAPLVDVALGEKAQYVVLDGTELLNQLASGTLRIPGRLGFLPLASGPSPGSTPESRGRAGVLARADEVLEPTGTLSQLAYGLLGGTWFVDSLADAFRLRDAGAPGERFVTRAGEVLETDGTLLLGQAQSSPSLVSRRSELRSLQHQVLKLRKSLADQQQVVDSLVERAGDREANVNGLIAEGQQLAARLAEQRIRTRTWQEKFEELDAARCRIEREAVEDRGQQSRLQTERGRLLEDIRRDAEMLATLEHDWQRSHQSLGQLEIQLQTAHREAAEARLHGAKMDQTVESLQLQLARFQDDQRERDRTLQEAHDQIERALDRRRILESDILKATSELADVTLEKERWTHEIIGANRQRESLTGHRGQILAELQTLRRQLQDFAGRVHQKELAAGEIRLQRQTLADRLREDYGLDFSQANHDTTAAGEPLVREEVEQEIVTLRKKINSLGAVNLEALGELDELERRFATLSGQYQDLIQAKETLEKIIQRINGDSRRLFSETLEAIRKNFQNLYRRAFGGGKADIVLEEGVDVLEAGIEIIATPPGKTSFNNSLLSGGEKALTAVALLLAIFEYRPSPFCVLDEVDAPFDEANIGRFVDVLHGFLDRTRFVIVTHSKKTMTSANTLYGVTMQESGVSKRVSVRFEDVSDDGRINPDALNREQLSPPQREAA